MRRGGVDVLILSVRLDLGVLSQSRSSADMQRMTTVDTSYIVRLGAWGISHREAIKKKGGGRNCFLIEPSGSRFLDLAASIVGRSPRVRRHDRPEWILDED
ncbi:hypothetical protein J3459_015093 [Metarhizium acridum]|nr:hypothetical protein J3459_015093 [Metarhizium acridum]